MFPAERDWPDSQAKMKYLKSKSSDLRRLFERAISVREIAEPLASFDIDRNAEAARSFMEAHNFDVVGVRDEGHIVGYVRRTHLGAGSLADYLVPFAQEEVILAETDSLLTAIQGLRERSELFVNVLGKPGAIVTKGDLQKSPVRLWLFGLISLIEMRMLRIIRDRFPGEDWKDLLTAARLSTAMKIFEERRQRNEEVCISDCLQICDKAAILLRDDALLTRTGFISRSSGERLFKFLEGLRNDLAHSNDILKGRWPELADRVLEAEQLLTRLEAI